jgi:hypothetical protein
MNVSLAVPTFPKGPWPDGTLCVLVGIIGFLVGLILGRVVFG